MAADAGGAPRPRERGVPAARQPAGAAHGAAQEARQEVRRSGPDLWGQGGQEGPEPVSCDGQPKFLALLVFSREERKFSGALVLSFVKTRAGILLFATFS